MKFKQIRKTFKFLFIFVAFLFLLVGFQSKNMIAHASTGEESAIRVVTPGGYDKISEKIAEIEKANPGIQLTTEQVQQIVNDLGLADIQVVAEEDTVLSTENSSQIHEAVSAGGVGFQQYSRTATSFRAQAQVINLSHVQQ